jgi:hypothetical protein
MCELTAEDIALFRCLSMERESERRLADLRRGGGPEQGASFIHALLPEEVGEDQDDQGDDT